MRKIEALMNQAVNSRRNWKRANTEVYTEGDHTSIYLHGNCICIINNKTGRRSFSCRGWHTVTTRSRLNALGADVRIKDGLIIYNQTGEVVSSHINVNP